MSGGEERSPEDLAEMLDRCVAQGAITPEEAQEVLEYVSIPDFRLGPRTIALASILGIAASGLVWVYPLAAPLPALIAGLLFGWVIPPFKP
jgi:hypothetical protein